MAIPTMSQHQFELNSPKQGHVQVTVGYDAQLSEAFLSYFKKGATFSTSGGVTIDDLQEIAVTQLGVELPQPVIDAVHGDLADLRLGASDVGRRITQYDPDGNVLKTHRW